MEKTKGKEKPGEKAVKQGASLVTRLNIRLFFRLLGIFMSMNVLLAALCVGGIFIWAEQQVADVAVLVEERGVPGAEATQWMAAGDYTVTALDRPPAGYQLRLFIPPDVTKGGLRTIQWSKTPLLFGTWRGNPAADMTYSVEQVGATGTPYAITLDLSAPVTAAVYAARILLVCQIISLIMNLLKNAGTIRKVLRPISDLAAAATKLGSTPEMTPKELRTLAGKLAEINATHLDTRLSVTGTQKELRDLAKAINAMLDRVGAAYDSQLQFVSDASHELRTPIAVIQGYANLLNRWGKEDPATMQEAIDAISCEADGMKTLVEQLLFLARGDNDSMGIAMSTFDATEVATEVLKESAMIDQTHPLSADWEGEVTLYADPVLIKQALRVLMDNAIKYTPAGGRITLSVKQKGQLVHMAVEDQGQGISKESMPSVFDRFYRTDQSRARQTGGSGLGLSIAKWIADRHGGGIEVTSVVEIGTRFTLVIPCQQ